MGTLMEHFNELLLVFVIIVLLVFVEINGHVHNDQLAGKGVEYMGQALAALLAILAAKKIAQ